MSNNIVIEYWKQNNNGSWGYSLDYLTKKYEVSKQKLAQLAIIGAPAGLSCSKCQGNTRFTSRSALEAGIRECLSCGSISSGNNEIIKETPLAKKIIKNEKNKTVISPSQSLKDWEAVNKKTEVVLKALHTISLPSLRLYINWLGFVVNNGLRKDNIKNWSELHAELEKRTGHTKEELSLLLKELYKNSLFYVEYKGARRQMYYINQGITPAVAYKILTERTGYKYPKIYKAISLEDVKFALENRPKNQAIETWVAGICDLVFSGYNYKQIEAALNKALYTNVDNTLNYMFGILKKWVPSNKPKILISINGEIG